MVSRSEGYRLGAGKEELALDVLERFLIQKMSVRTERIEGYDENYQFGDLCAPSGVTIECKGQGIDPVRFPQNFVEVFEATNNAARAGGFADVAELLGLTVLELSEATVRMRDGSLTTVGRLPYVSVSIRSIVQSRFTAYVNYEMGGKHIYLYENDEIVTAIREAVWTGMVRGAGRSNEDTFAVRIPVARMRWYRVGAQWIYGGVDDERGIILALRRELL